MTAALTITVRGTPAPQGSKKFVGRSNAGYAIMIESSKKVQPWRQAVVDAALTAITDLTTDKLLPGYPLDEPLIAAVVFTMPKPASAPKNRRTWPMRYPDLSKLIRSTEDALRDAGVFRDDARIVEYRRLAKVFAGEDPDSLDVPGAVIRLWRIQQIDAGLATPPQRPAAPGLFDPAVTP